jgi:hypothetical protein
VRSCSPRQPAHTSAYPYWEVDRSVTYAPAAIRLTIESDQAPRASVEVDLPLLRVFLYEYTVLPLTSAAIILSTVCCVKP